MPIRPHGSLGRNEVTTVARRHARDEHRVGVHGMRSNRATDRLPGRGRRCLDESGATVGHHSRGGLRPGVRRSRRRQVHAPECRGDWATLDLEATYARNSQEGLIATVGTPHLLGDRFLTPSRPWREMASIDGYLGLQRRPDRRRECAVPRRWSAAWLPRCSPRRSRQAPWEVTLKDSNGARW